MPEDISMKLTELFTTRLSILEKSTDDHLNKIDNEKFSFYHSFVELGLTKYYYNDIFIELEENTSAKRGRKNNFSRNESKHESNTLSVKNNSLTERKIIHRISDKSPCLRETVSYKMKKQEKVERSKSGHRDFINVFHIDPKPYEPLILAGFGNPDGDIFKNLHKSQDRLYIEDANKSNYIVVSSSAKLVGNLNISKVKTNAGSDNLKVGSIIKNKNCTTGKNKPETIWVEDGNDRSEAPYLNNRIKESAYKSGITQDKGNIPKEFGIKSHKDENDISKNSFINEEICNDNNTQNNNSVIPIEASHYRDVQETERNQIEEIRSCKELDKIIEKNEEENENKEVSIGLKHEIDYTDEEVNRIDVDKTIIALENCKDKEVESRTLNQNNTKNNRNHEYKAENINSKENIQSQNSDVLNKLINPEYEKSNIKTDRDNLIESLKEKYNQYFHV